MSDNFWAFKLLKPQAISGKIKGGDERERVGWVGGQAGQQAGKLRLG
jgi:hypothetical protein